MGNVGESLELLGWARILGSWGLGLGKSPTLSPRASSGCCPELSLEAHAGIIVLGVGGPEGVLRLSVKGKGLSRTS